MGVIGAARRITGTAALAALLAVAAGAPARAQAPFDAPWTEVAPHIDDGREAVVVAALGRPDARVGRFSAAKVTARVAGRQRARQRLGRWADEALAQAHVPAWHADRVHAAVRRAAKVTNIRPRVDGSAIVVVEVPVAALRRAWSAPGVPWHR